MTRAIVGQWGKSLGVRLPADVSRAMGLRVGQAVDVVARDGELILKPVEKTKVTIDDLFAGKSSEEWRALYQDSAVDWGPDVGREIIEE